MKRFFCVGVVVASCGTAPAVEEAVEEAAEASAEAIAPTTREAEATNVSSQSEDEATEANVPAEATRDPMNFVTPHHCHPPGPCNFVFEALRGAQYIDVGHGHSSAPRLNATLRIAEGEARVETVAAGQVREGQGTLFARPRDSLEGSAYFVTLRGEASAVELELRFME